MMVTEIFLPYVQEGERERRQAKRETGSEIEIPWRGNGSAYLGQLTKGKKTLFKNSHIKSHNNPVRMVGWILPPQNEEAPKVKK